MPAFLRPSPNATPGTAMLVISPWPGPDSADLEVSLQSNNSHNAHLDSQGQWQGSPHWIAIPAGQVVAGELCALVGPTLVDPVLERRSSNAIRLTARQQAQTVATHALQVDDAVLSSAAAGLTPDLATSGAMQQQPEPLLDRSPKTDFKPVLETAPAISPAPPSQAVAPEQPERPPQSRSKLALWIGLAVLVLAAIALALWWFLLRTPKPLTTEPAAVVATPAAPAATPLATCSIANLANAQEMAFVQQCIQDGTDSASLLQVIAAARDGGQCGIAQRLYANRAQSGDTAIALAYAREYHPQFHSASNCFGAAEPATARYWYEEVLQREPDNAQAKEELEMLQ